jgi:hypothetical protein
MRYALPMLLFATIVLSDCDADNCLRAFRATQTPGRLEVCIFEGQSTSYSRTTQEQYIAEMRIPVYSSDDVILQNLPKDVMTDSSII